MHERTSRPRLTGAIAGATAAGPVLGATQLLHSADGFMTLQQVTSGGVLRLVPGSVFGYVIDGLQEKARPLFLLGLSIAVIAAGALAGVALALASCSRGKRARAPEPDHGQTEPAERRPLVVSAMRALACSVVLWAISMLFVLLGDPSVFSAATVSVFAEWLAVALLIEAALSSPAVSAGGGRMHLRLPPAGRSRGRSQGEGSSSKRWAAVQPSPRWVTSAPARAGAGCAIAVGKRWDRHATAPN